MSKTGRQSSAARTGGDKSGVGAAIVANDQELVGPGGGDETRLASLPRALNEGLHPRSHRSDAATPEADMAIVCSGWKAAPYLTAFD